MRWITLSWISLALFLPACEYEAPVAAKQDLPIDSTVLGHWKFVPEKANDSRDPEEMLILKYSQTEYLIFYPSNSKSGMFFRGYPVRIGKTDCVQIQCVGTSRGNIKPEERKYHLLTYQFSEPGQIVLRILNTDLLDDDLDSTEALEQAFLKHENDPELFCQPGTFRKLSKSR